ncbi:hypothetical protein MoryE10_26940 [Methylogaea oryzae]|uniref:Uncharacterized protein n=1 Tax=Methylogaea oryzae TaxID=1295382 RepID=A0A8D5AI30_9GAMM|nr:hypothetical protein MoryE10_26940 [Methylogaea oryzae]
MKFALPPNLLLEAGAALLFLGALSQQYPRLPDAGAQALRELAELGYRVPGAEQPLRVYPAATGGEFSARHGAGWRPGAIYLRPSPQGDFGMGVYLRHELMHEASFLTCGGKLPLWAEEAAAMGFSGELAAPSAATPPTAAALERLRVAVGNGSSLDDADRRVLAGLIAASGWPTQPCAVSKSVEKLLGAPFAEGSARFSYVLMSQLSGRVLESGGDLHTRYPPGSLLKIPYAAALREAEPTALGEELAASDTAKLLRRKAAFDSERYRLLLATVAGAAPGQAVPAGQSARADEVFWRRYLGERGEDGGFPYQASLPELAAAMRAALLSNPAVFAGLARNGVSPLSTLYREDAADKQVLARMHALAKTGSVTDPAGKPLVGHLLVAWPADNPLYLALFRQVGGKGAGNLHAAAPYLAEWARRYPPAFAKVRVRLMTLLPRSAWEIRDDCPAFDGVPLDGWTPRISLCGRFRLVSSARGSLSERLVTGVLRQAERDGATVLETDAETYADAVLAAEADRLSGQARAALRAVIVWNGTHGAHRHGDSGSLCDHTHCMVFQGAPADRAPPRAGRSEAKLLALLDTLAAAQNLDWLPFAKGGDERWQRRLPTAQAVSTLKESQVLDLRRERRRDGAVFVHLWYGDSEEVLPCETFRAAFALPSCPDAIQPAEGGAAWRLEGVGAGHGLGLSVSRAKALAESGTDAAGILRDAYGAGRSPLVVPP